MELEMGCIDSRHVFGIRDLGHHVRGTLPVSKQRHRFRTRRIAFAYCRIATGASSYHTAFHDGIPREMLPSRTTSVYTLRTDCAAYVSCQYIAGVVLALQCFGATVSVTESK